MERAQVAFENGDFVQVVFYNGKYLPGCYSIQPGDCEPVNILIALTFSTQENSTDRNCLSSSFVILTPMSPEISQWAHGDCGFIW